MSGSKLFSDGIQSGRFLAAEGIAKKINGSHQLAIRLLDYLPIEDRTAVLRLLSKGLFLGFYGLGIVAWLTHDLDRRKLRMAIRRRRPIPMHAIGQGRVRLRSRLACPFGPRLVAICTLSTRCRVGRRTRRFWH